MNNSTLFQEDDYDELYRYFLPLRDGAQIDADPSGWIDTYAAAADLLPPFRVTNLAQYRIDEGRSLGSAKEKIVALLRDWEQYEIEMDNVTLCHSVSEASLMALIFLKSNGISTIVFESPAYGVSIKQARYVGLATRLCPTYIDDDYEMHLDAMNLSATTPIALWLTQPRMSLGYDQPTSFINSALETLSARDFLVIDEATEQRFPSHLRDLWSRVDRPNILRLRGFLKGVGLNGLRLAFVLHDARFRNELEAAQELIGSSLDSFSLQVAVAIADTTGRLKILLETANRQTTSLRAKADKIAFGSEVRMSGLVNGYIGSAMLDLKSIPGSHEQKRKRLLSFCFDRRMPVLLSSTMRFAFDPNWEKVRINYFNQPKHVLKAVFNFGEFLAGS
ncbi:MAG TPA: aminotransferase class I/II-fold pyridoxal phosphate-dependent enzyme [Thermoanaerobaculia bacterium]|nr:aminotransferase class I/II-fold pyridoxal phosphate-dependent enzyme [Thermoanaerobaculia bacterium]